MDDLALLDNQDEGDEEDDAYRQRVLLCAALVGYGIVQAHQIRAERRRLGRHHLYRRDLLPNPRSSTPWQQLYTTQDDKAFITVVGLDISAFNLILSRGFERGWTNHLIPRADTPSTCNPRMT